MPKRIDPADIYIPFIDIAVALEEQLEHTPSPEEIKKFHDYLEIDIGQWLSDNVKSFLLKIAEDKKTITPSSLWRKRGLPNAQTKQLPCGCIMERYSKKGKWYVITLCRQHVKEYYLDPNKFLEEHQ